MSTRKLSHKSLTARISELRRKHRALDEKVASEEMRVWPDAGRIKQLKRERLGLRDTIRATQALLRRAAAGPRASA